MPEIAGEFADLRWVDSIEAVYRSEGQRIERALLGAFNDPELAAEATSEAFAQLLRRGPAVRQPRNWVWRASFAIAKGFASDPTRRDVGVPVESAVVDADYPFEVVAALRQLSPMQRQAVVLHYYAGFPLRDVAAMTASTRGALKVHLHRARIRLRQLLQTEVSSHD